MNADNSAPARRLRSPAELPRELAPRRDLWPAIAAGIARDAQARPEAVSPARSAKAWPRISWALAAGMAALTIGVLLGRMTLPTGDPSVAGNAGLAAGGFYDAAYTRERDRLRADVLERLNALPAAEREKLLQSVRALRRAVDEIQAALGRDPGNALLQELLVNACQDEMTNLSDINQAAGATPAPRQSEMKL